MINYKKISQNELSTLHKEDKLLYSITLYHNTVINGKELEKYNNEDIINIIADNNGVILVNSKKLASNNFAKSENYIINDNMYLSICKNADNGKPWAYIVYIEKDFVINIKKSILERMNQEEEGLTQSQLIGIIESELKSNNIKFNEKVTRSLFSELTKIFYESKAKAHNANIKNGGNKNE